MSTEVEIISFNKYQENTRLTKVYDADRAAEYLVLGLCSESGEVAGLLKKKIRGDGGLGSEEFKSKLRSEMGDVLWYLARLADEHGIWLDEIAAENNKKLFDRLERKVIHGDGDYR